MAVSDFDKVVQKPDNAERERHQHRGQSKLHSLQPEQQSCNRNGEQYHNAAHRRCVLLFLMRFGTGLALELPELEPLQHGNKQRTQNPDDRKSTQRRQKDIEHNAIITQSPRARQARFACLASRLFALSYQGVLPAKNPHVGPLWERACGKMESSLIVRRAVPRRSLCRQNDTSCR